MPGSSSQRLRRSFVLFKVPAAEKPLAKGRNRYLMRRRGLEAVVIYLYIKFGRGGKLRGLIRRSDENPPTSTSEDQGSIEIDAVGSTEPEQPRAKEDLGADWQLSPCTDATERVRASETACCSECVHTGPLRVCFPETPHGQCI